MIRSSGENSIKTGDYYVQRQKNRIIVSSHHRIMDEILQWITVAFNLGFLLFMIRERVIAWPLGIAGSLIFIYLSFTSKLYLESLVYVFYVIMGFYGWYRWKKGPESIENKDGGNAVTGIVLWPLRSHLTWIITGFVGTAFLGYVFNTFTDARYSYQDAFSTVFQLIATYLEARKVLSAWLYWIVLNLFAIWLYNRAGLDIVATFQMIPFAVFSVAGYFVWKKRFRNYAVVNS